MRCQARLILSECYSPDLFLWIELSCYFTRINCPFTIHSLYFLVVSTALWPNFNSCGISSQTRQCCSFIREAFKSHIVCTNAQRVSVSATTILLFKADTFYGLTCFVPLIYALQTRRYYQNIAKFLTRPSGNFEFLGLVESDRWLRWNEEMISISHQEKGKSQRGDPRKNATQFPSSSI